MVRRECNEIGPIRLNGVQKKKKKKPAKKINEQKSWNNKQLSQKVGVGVTYI